MSDILFELHMMVERARWANAHLEKRIKEHENRVKEMQAASLAAQGVKMRLEQLADVLGDLAPRVAEYIAADLSRAAEVETILKQLAELRSSIKLSEKKLEDVSNQRVAAMEQQLQLQRELKQLAAQLGKE